MYIDTFTTDIKKQELNKTFAKFLSLKSYTLDGLVNKIGGVITIALVLYDSEVELFKQNCDVFNNKNLDARLVSNFIFFKYQLTKTCLEVPYHYELPNFVIKLSKPLNLKGELYQKVWWALDEKFFDTLGCNKWA